MGERTRKLKKTKISGKKLIFGLMAALCLLPLASCKKKSPQEDDNNQILLGFSQIGAESEWRIRNTQSILEAAERNNIQILYENAQQKQENQLQAIHSFIIYQVDVIAFVPIVENGWDNVLQEAKEAGIPVIVVDRKLASDPSLYTAYIGEDGTAEGRKAAEFLLEKYKGVQAPLNILELYGTENSSPAYERATSFRKTLQNYPNFKVIHSERGDFLRSKGHEIGNKILYFNGGLSIGQTPIDIIFSHNDAMTWGVLDAFYEHEIDPRDVTIVTIDGERRSIQAIKNGSINCVVECNPNTGEQLCAIVKQIMDGNPVTPVSYVDGATYTEFDDFSTFEGKGF